MTKLKAKNPDVEIVYIPPSEIIPYPANNKTHSDEQIRMLAGMIKQYGFDVPIVVDSEMVIIKGHARQKAAIMAGIETVPVIVKTDLSPAEIKMSRIADNRIAELGKWDNDILKAEIQAIQELVPDFNPEYIGFDLSEIDELLEEINFDNFFTEAINQEKENTSLDENEDIDDDFNFDKKDLIILEFPQDQVADIKKDLLKHGGTFEDAVLNLLGWE